MPHPGCSRTQPPLAPRAQPGYCAWCDRWLGSRLPDETCPPTVSEEVRWHRWVESAVSELLVVAPRLSSELRRSNIAVSVEKVMNGNQLALARRIQVTQASVWQWLEGESIPQLGTLLRICFHLDVSPLSFLTGRVETPSHQKEPLVPQPMKKPMARQHKRFDVERMRSILEAALCSTEEPPPSMADITRSLGYDQANFRRYFPELCRAISRRYLNYLSKTRLERIQKLCEEVRQVTLSLHA